MGKIKTLSQEIENEMRLCEREIEKCRKQRAIIEERERCFDDRKVMLLGLLEIAQGGTSE